MTTCNPLWLQPVGVGTCESMLLRMDQKSLQMIDSQRFCNKSKNIQIVVRRAHNRVEARLSRVGSDSFSLL